jgi:hypothetical protein
MLMIVNILLVFFFAWGLTVFSFPQYATKIFFWKLKFLFGINYRPTFRTFLIFRIFGLLVSILAALIFVSFLDYIPPDSISQNQTDFNVKEEQKTESENKTKNKKTFVNTESGISFSYSDSNILSEIKNEKDLPNFYEGFLISDKKDFEDAINSKEQKELPPLTKIYIFKNPKDLSVEDWVSLETKPPKFDLKTGPLIKTKIDNIPAISYRTEEGFYLTNNTVLTINGFVLLISGSFLEEGDKGGVLYNDILDSLNIIVATAPVSDAGEYPEYYPHPEREIP